MTQNFPIYSHPYRAKVVMLKGQKGDTPTVSVTSTTDEVIITATNPNDGHPETTSATIVRPKVSAETTDTGATITAIDQFGVSTANILNGRSVTGAALDNAHHLIVTLSDGSTVDAGEVPLNALEVAYSTNLDGTTNEITLPNDFDTSDISYLLVNGLTVTDGWTISGNTLTIPYEAGSIPSGKLEIVKNAAGYITDGNLAALSDAEIIAITEGGSPTDNYGTIQVYTDATQTSTFNVPITTQGDFEALCTGHEFDDSGWEATIDGETIEGNNIVGFTAGALATDYPDGFLSWCPNLSNIQLHANTTTIGSDFLAHATSFNSDIDLTANITSIGDYFLYDCPAMTGTINFGELPATIATASDWSFAVYGASAAAYTTGMSIEGTYANDWKARFPDRSSQPYRKLNVI